MVHKLTLAYIYAHEYGSKVNTSLCRSVMKANITHIVPMFYNPWLFFQMAAGTFTFEHVCGSSCASASWSVKLSTQTQRRGNVTFLRRVMNAEQSDEKEVNVRRDSIDGNMILNRALYLIFT